MILSALSDLLSLSTVHVYLFYMVAARIYYWQLSVIWSLFNLFRGMLVFLVVLWGMWVLRD